MSKTTVRLDVILDIDYYKEEHFMEKFKEFLDNYDCGAKLKLTQPLRVIKNLDYYLGF